MWPYVVVLSAPAFNQDLSFGQSVEYLPVQELVTQGAVEALALAVLLWAAWREVERLHSDLRQPLLHRIGDKGRGLYLTVCAPAGPG